MQGTSHSGTNIKWWCVLLLIVTVFAITSVGGSPRSNPELGKLPGDTKNGETINSNFGNLDDRTRTLESEVRELRKVVQRLSKADSSQPGVVAQQEVSAHIVLGRTDRHGAFRIEIPNTIAKSQIVGITAAVKNASLNWHSAHSTDRIFNDFWWSSTSGVVAGHIQHESFANRDVRIVLFVKN